MKKLDVFILTFLIHKIYINRNEASETSEKVDVPVSHRSGRLGTRILQVRLLKDYYPGPGLVRLRLEGKAKKDRSDLRHKVNQEEQPKLIKTSGPRQDRGKGHVCSQTSQYRKVVQSLRG